jgi:hypothetical protein
MGESVCNCEDVYRTTLCPIHDVDKAIAYNNIITDEDLVEGEIRKWTGMCFKCKKCGQESVMDFSKFCGNCGAEVRIQSVKLTAVMNEMSAKVRT